VKKMAYRLTRVTYKFIKQDQNNIDKIKMIIEKARGCSLEGKFKIINTKYMFYYIYQGIFSFLFELILLTVTSLLLGTFIETMLVSLSFGLVRIFAGGMHLDSSTKCTVISWLTFILAGLLAKHLIVFFKFVGVVTLYKQIIFLVFSTIMGIYVLYAPAENHNRRLISTEKTKFKAYAIMILMSLFVVQIVINNNVVSNSILIGVTISGIIVTPFANRYCK
jgi:accessory gene regulator B